MFTRRILSLATVGFTGCAFGSLLERWRTKQEILHAANVSSVPTFAMLPAEPPAQAGPISHITRLGFPANDNLLAKEDYILSYDRRNRTAHWVLEHLTKEKLESNSVNRELCQFTEDSAVHPYYRAKNDDYHNSGFDRGHLAAARNHHLGQKQCQQTFYLSNIAPQVGKGFNRDAWNNLEKHARNLAKKAYKNVYICTGPLYLPRHESDGKLYVKYQVIGKNHVAVPTHFFKVIVGETDSGQFDIESYVLPNAVIDDSTPLRNFQVPVESIERAAGFMLFDRLPKEAFRFVNQRKSTTV